MTWRLLSFFPLQSRCRCSFSDHTRAPHTAGFVFTSGGIGPTHDDVTYEAIAEAFAVPLELHAPTVERMRASYAKRGMELNEARLRMVNMLITFLCMLLQSQELPSMDSF